MTHYVDGFLLPIGTERLSEYKKIASEAGAIWKEHGALAYWECVGDDLNIPDMVSFKQAAGCTENETLVLAWIIYSSREARDLNEAIQLASQIPPAGLGTIEIRPIRELDPEKDERFQQSIV